MTRTPVPAATRAPHPAPAPGAADGTYAGLFQNLAPDGRFRRDSRLGRLFHPRTVSYREARATDSVHLVVNDDKVSVHIDRFSPLAVQGTTSWRRYAPVRMLAHGLVDVVGEITSVLRRRHEHPHELVCERVWVDDDADPDDGVGHDDDDDSPSGDAEGESVPFNVADEAVHLVDSAAEPWSVHLEARVPGRLDDDRLRGAVAAAVAVHPLARARRAPFHWSDHQFQWQIDAVADADPLSVVECADDRALTDARNALQSVSVPLAASPPLRVVLAHHPAGDVVMLNANHAATDGFGALRFCRSVARAYTGTADPVPDLDLLGARNLTAGMGDAPRPARLRPNPAVLEKLSELVVPPARIAVDGGRDEPGYGINLVSLSTHETQAIADHDDRGTVNELLLTALCLCVAAWNADHEAPAGRVSVLVPANLRPERWSDEVVGNFTLPARVSVRPEPGASCTTTLAAVIAQTNRRKRTGMGTALTETFGASPLLPLWAKQAVSPVLAATADRLVDTAVFSDLGTLDEVMSFGPEAGDVGAVHFSE
ncbi:MAG: hypothetical protein M3011_08905, partial [Actinomycetota bacterium]|nr:hypothetical protein [Actinomycetota bacterium]